MINLRGKVIPLVDLRLKSGMPPADYTKETCIIVVDVESLLMGIIVDTVSEVLDIKEGDLVTLQVFEKPLIFHRKDAEDAKKNQNFAFFASLR